MIKQYICAVSLTVLFLLPTSSRASEFIPLADHEEKLIKKGDIIVREVDTTRKSGGRTFEAIGLVNASRADVLNVLTDYETYPEFMPNVSKIEVVEKKENVTIHQKIQTNTVLVPQQDSNLVYQYMLCRTDLSFRPLLLYR